MLSMQTSKSEFKSKNNLSLKAQLKIENLLDLEKLEDNVFLQISSLQICSLLMH